jgi:uncharacterized protein YggE
MLRRVSLAVALIALLVVGVGAASAQDAQPYPTNTITVSGYGTAFGEPNLAYIEMGVELVEADLATAYSGTADRMNAVIEALSGLNIARSDIQTTGVNIYPEDRYDPQTGTPTERVYRVRNTVRVTVRDVAQIEQVITTGVNAGVNTIYNLSFGLADNRALQSEARTQAVADARSRAEELAAALGVTVGAPVIVSEVIQSGGIPYFDGRGGGGVMMAESAQPVSGGQLSVSVEVQITFAIGGAE